MSKIFILVLLAFSLPVKLLAAIVIHEVAWMGDVSSANHEWIELHNTGSDSVSVDNWVLTDEANLSISLSGVIAGSSYAVLERTSEESAPGSAFLIYTGALVNTGTTLTLKDQTGAIMDQVAGGENWQEIGGDNVTKETAQYTSRGWVTAPATPGAANSTAASDHGNTDGTQSTATTTVVSNSATVNTKNKNTGSKSTVRLGTKETVLKVVPDVQTVAYVNQSIPFSVTATGVGETIVKSLVHTWNFGDSYTATGTRVTHHYEYPGTYVVTVRSRYAKHDETARHELTILPVTFSITKNELGDVQIHNDAPYDIDVSGYTVRGQKEVLLPPRSLMVSRGTLTIAAKRLYTDVADGVVSLYDTKEMMVATTPRSTSVPAATASLPVATTWPTTEASYSEPVIPLAPIPTEVIAAPAMVSEAVVPDENSVIPQAAPVRWPYVVLMVMLTFALLIVFSKKAPVTKLE